MLHFFSNPEHKVVLNDYWIPHPSVTYLMFIYSNNAIVTWIAELSIGPDESYFITGNLKHLIYIQQYVFPL